MPRFVNCDPLILFFGAAERREELIVPIHLRIEAAAVVGGAHPNAGSGLRLGERGRRLRVASLGRISFRHNQVLSYAARACARG